MTHNFSPDVQYKAHEVLVSRAALLRRDTEATTDQMTQLQEKIDQAIDRNHQLQDKFQDDEPELAKLQTEEQQLMQAWETLEEGHGNMQFGAQAAEVA